MEVVTQRWANFWAGTRADKWSVVVTHLPGGKITYWDAKKIC